MDVYGALDIVDTVRTQQNAAAKADGTWLLKPRSVSERIKTPKGGDYKDAAHYHKGFAAAIFCLRLSEIMLRMGSDMASQSLDTRITVPAWRRLCHNVG